MHILIYIILFFNFLAKNTEYINLISNDEDTLHLSENISKIDKNLDFISHNLVFKDDSILLLALKTIELSEQFGYEKGINYSYVYIGDIFKIRNNYDSAIYYYEKGISTIKNNNDLKAEYYWNLSDIYRITGNLSASLENALNLKSLNENNLTTKYNYKVYNLLALSYQSLMEYELAKINFKKSADLAIVDSNFAYAGVIYSNIGKLLFNQDSLKEALSYFKEGMKLEEQYQIYGSLANSCVIVAEIYTKLNQLDSTYSCLVKSIKYAKQSKNKVTLTNVLYAASKYYFQIKDYSSCKWHLDRTIENAKQFNLNIILSEAYMLRSKLNELYKDYKNAYADLENSYSIHSKIYDVKEINKVKALEQKLLQQEKQTQLIELELKKQKTINLLLYLIAFLSVSIGILAIIFVIRLKRLNKALKVSKNKAEESDKLKSQFLKTISHEIRTPLNGIIGFSDMIVSEKIDKNELNEIQHYIYKNSFDLINTIENLVDMAHLNTNQYPLNISRFKILPLLEMIIKQAKESLVIQYNKKIEILLGNIQDIEIESDKNALKKILNLLILNAIKFTDSGFVKVEFEKNNSEYTLIVKDTGIGISKEKQKIIFNPFRIGDEQFSIKSGGTGLGLAIVKNLTHILHGQIVIDSENGKGTTFFIRFPFNQN